MFIYSYGAGSRCSCRLLLFHHEAVVYSCVLALASDPHFVQFKLFNRLRLIWVSFIPPPVLADHVPKCVLRVYILHFPLSRQVMLPV